MTITFRNQLIQILSFISFLINGFLGFFVYQNYSAINELFINETIQSQKWWFILKPGSGDTMMISILSLFLLVIAGLLGNWLLHLSFRKSSSQEMFYFRIFLLCLSLSGLRVLHYFIELKHFGMYYHLILTRISYFLRLLGLGSLFLSGIAIFEKKFQRMSMIFLSVLAITFIMSMIIPVNQDFILGSLLNRLMDEVTLFMFILVLQVMVFMNFVMYFYQRRSKDNFSLLIGILMILVSLDLSYFLTVTGIIMTVTLLPLGIYLYSRKIFNLYLWR